MSTPTNPSAIMLFKIIKDFENNGETIHSILELEGFSKRVLKFANSISREDFWMVNTPEIKEDISKICDITESLCEINKEKFLNGGYNFAQKKIGSMPYSWLKGSVKALNEIDDFKKQHPNTSMLIVEYPGGEKRVSAICLDKGPIVIEEDSLSK